MLVKIDIINLIIKLFIKNSPVYQVTKILFTGIILTILISGCRQNSPTSISQISGAKISGSNTSNSQCPDKPTGSLESKDVKPIQLSSQTLTETGQVRADKNLGYTFTAKQGQKLSSQTNDDICIWVYAPDNQIITNKDLMQTGKYIIQVSAPQGVRNFELKLGLNISQSLVASSSTPSSTSVQTNLSTTTKPNPEIFVREHYILLNNREYSKTWNRLSSRFKSESASYSEYQQWWNSVREIKIGDIKEVSQSGDRAIVDAELWYVKHNGKTYQDSKNRIYLIWSNDNNSWLFDSKASP
ncbi:hypothetical protein A0J48_010225 [Sphaerospermopsis aphanizomenoides BCCUSP55]|uniref:hypothetical protein n=1 Tax=Sphaerospermopsis aphanizomenoides TaxID=459663 RepID=UPI00190704D1|nr:hypothetical protein [Sphaerospermopsis aphanizomenoides]MBK1987911.1 hypothetical protein [Sphaerospermopsis aphanizomenoides BCCUSP55]